jgi:sugar lactone lactonase YvrE
MHFVYQPRRWTRYLSSTLLGVLLSSVIGVGVPSAGLAAPLDTSPDAVLGQTGLDTTAPNQGGVATASTLNAPFAIATDHSSGRLYVADFSNSRVLSWPDAAGFTNGQAADLVIGQPSFSSTAANQGSSPSAATLSRPIGLAVDQRNGDLFVADYDNHRVLQYFAPAAFDRVADRVFGQGGSFTTTNPNKGGTSADSLSLPAGVAVSDDGKLFVADSFNHRVLMYVLDGNTSADVVFGQKGDFTSSIPNNGLGGGPLSSTLNDPEGVAVDSVGNLYIADSGNHRVVEYTAPQEQRDALGAAAIFGQPSWVTNDLNHGGLSAGSLNYPIGVAVDAADNLLVADTNNHRVLRYDAPLVTDQLADAVFGQGSFTSGAANSGGAAGGLNIPRGMATSPSGDLLVADSDNHRVLRYDRPIAMRPNISDLDPNEVAVDTNEFSLTISGNGFVKGSQVQIDGAQRPAIYRSPTRLEVVVKAEDIAGLASIRRIAVLNLGPGGGSDTSILQTYNRLNRDTVADAVLGQAGFTSKESYNPRFGRMIPLGIAVDPRSGRLYVADGFNRVLSWPSAAAFRNSQAPDMVIGQGNFLDVAPNRGSDSPSAASLSTPFGVAVDGSGNLYVADALNHRVLEYDRPATTDTIADRVWGQGSSFTSKTPNNGGLSRGLNLPVRVALDSAGNLYISDDANHRVLEYDAPLSGDQVADRVFGQASLADNKPNRGSAVPDKGTLNLPFDLAFDGAGNLYISDGANHRVLEYDAPLSGDQDADRVFGQPDFAGHAPNRGAVAPAAASLDTPAGVAVDRAGNLYVADFENSRVLEYDAPLSGDTSADRVFGQTSLITNTTENSISSTTLNRPYDVALDTSGNVYVADGHNQRLLAFDTPLPVVTPEVRRLYLPLVVK